MQWNNYINVTKHRRPRVICAKNQMAMLRKRAPKESTKWKYYNKANSTFVTTKIQSNSDG